MILQEKKMECERKKYVLGYELIEEIYYDKLDITTLFVKKLYKMEGERCWRYYGENVLLFAFELNDEVVLFESAQEEEKISC